MKLFVVAHDPNGNNPVYLNKRGVCSKRPGIFYRRCDAESRLTQYRNVRSNISPDWNAPEWAVPSDAFKIYTVLNLVMELEN